MGVRPGYKQTEVGVIPEDWEAVPVGDHFTFKNGLNKARQFFGRGTPIVNYMDVFAKPSLRIDEIVGQVDVSPNELNAYNVRKGDVFFTRTSETVEEIGTASVMLDEPERTVYSGFVLRARPINDSLDDSFKAYCFSPRYFREQVIARASYTTRALTNGRSLSAALLARPPLPEQRAIATALSDVDALLAALDQLITKKRDLKQAAMQQLLTGQTRLPGFNGGWEISALKRFVRTFIVPMRDKPKRLTGDIPWCRIEDFDGMYLADSRSGQGVDTATIRSMNLKVYPAGTLLVSCSANLGRCAIAARPLVSNQTFIGLEVDDRAASNVFFYYLMTFEADRLNSVSSGTTISYLPRQKFQEFAVFAPLDKHEQVAIAAVLFDMDAEIVALEARRDKTRDLKKGMMQELLTGRTRFL